MGLILPWEAVLHVIYLFYSPTFASLSLHDFQLLPAFPGMTCPPSWGLSQQVSSHSICSQVPVGALRFLGLRETLMDSSPWQWSLIPAPERDSWLMIPNNLAGVTFFLPEIKMFLFYTKQA